MSCYSISVSERMPTEAQQSNGKAFDIVVDIENDSIEFHSEDGTGTIRLDLICAAEVADTLLRLVSEKDFQTALAKKVSEHLGRHNANDASIP